MDDYIPPPPKLVRQVNKPRNDESYELPQLRPLAWSTLENPEYPSFSNTTPVSLEELPAPRVPTGIRPNSSYPVWPHMSLKEMCQDLQE